MAITKNQLAMQLSLIFVKSFLHNVYNAYNVDSNTVLWDG